MVTIARTKGTLQITFPVDATIASVEEDVEAIRSAVAKAKKLTTIEMNCSGIEAIDTAYLQLLLAILKIGDTEEVVIKTGEGAERLHQILELYGMVDDDLFWTLH